MNIQQQLDLWPGTSEEGILGSSLERPVLETVERWFLEAQIRLGKTGPRRKRSTRMRPPQLPYGDQ
jgi:hypothetical protein